MRAKNFELGIITLSSIFGSRGERCSAGSNDCATFIVGRIPAVEYPLCGPVGTNLTHVVVHPVRGVLENVSAHLSIFWMRNSIEQQGA